MALLQTLQLHPDDNVAMAVVSLPVGCRVPGDAQAMSLRQPIPAGHKYALQPIAAGELVLKYGQPIGRAVVPIRAGEHVHVHNVESLRGRGDLGSGQSASPDAADWCMHHSGGAGSGRQEGQPHWPGDKAGEAAITTRASVGLAPATFLGYRRRNGRVGVRNHVLVLAAVGCANAVVDRIGQALPGVVAISHVYGCGQIGDDLVQTRRVLEGFAGHPNVGAVLLIGLGCETMPTAEIAEKLGAEGVRIERLSIQDEGGNRMTFARGLAVVQELLVETSRARRQPVPLSELVVAVECGGSDAWSGVTANPAVGAASDLVVKAGGTVILSETTEFIGAEHLLAARAATSAIAQAIVGATRWREQEARRAGVDMRGGQPTPGNIAGGLTTIEEKSLGAIAKGGSTPVREFLCYAHQPSVPGLVVMDTPGNDPESVTGMAAGGAQLVVFTTGRGSPTGCPIAPVIKVASNSDMYRRLADDMDLDAGTILEAGEPLASVGDRVFSEIIAVAEGKQTAAELWGHKEFAINTVEPRL